MLDRKCCDGNAMFVDDFLKSSLEFVFLSNDVDDLYRVVILFVRLFPNECDADDDVDDAFLFLSLKNRFKSAEYVFVESDADGLLFVLPLPLVVVTVDLKL